MKRRFLVIFLISIISVIYASNNPLVDRAMDKMDYDEELFSYSVLSISEGTMDSSMKLYRFNPEIDDRYELLEIDGETPTNKEIRKFIKDRNKDREDREKEEDDFSGDYYEKISESDGIAQFKYVTKTDMVPKTESKMNAKIWVDIEKEVVLRLEIESSKDIKVTFGVSMKQFKMEFNFKQYNNEITVIDTMNMEFTGKVAVAEIKQKSKIHMYDYKLVH